MTHEFEKLENLDTVGQGDLIEWVGTSRQSPWQCYGVVVTADCDLAHEKHGGVISYVPAMQTEDFIWSTWRVDRFAAKLTDYLNKAGQRLTNWRSKHGEENVSAPSPEAMQAWLERVGCEGVLNDLKVANPGERKDLLNALLPAISLIDLLRTPVPDLSRLKTAYEIINPKAVGTPVLLANEIQKSWGSLPGDIFHLPAMPRPNDTGHGLFLHLRHIRQVAAEQVTARPEDIRSGHACAQRIARVSAPYRYAITQALARVFSDIGLPYEHDARCRSAAQRFLANENNP